MVIWTHALAVSTGAATPYRAESEAGSAGLHRLRADPNEHRIICCDLFALAGRSSAELAMEGPFVLRRPSMRRRSVSVAVRCCGGSRTNIGWTRASAPTVPKNPSEIAGANINEIAGLLRG